MGVYKLLHPSLQEMIKTGRGMNKRKMYWTNQLLVVATGTSETGQTAVSIQCSLALDTEGLQSYETMNLILKAPAMVLCGSSPSKLNTFNSCGSGARKGHQKRP